MRQTLKSWMKMWNMTSESRSLTSRMKTKRYKKQKVSRVTWIGELDVTFHALCTVNVSGNINLLKFSLMR